jgi:two-component system OmpR family sensor kinase
MPMTKQPFTLVIVDGHDRACAALADHLQRVDGVLALGAVGELAQVEELIGRVRPHAVLVDCRAMGVSPLAAVDQLVSTDASTLVYTTSLADSEAEGFARLTVQLPIGHERGGLLEGISAQPDKFSDGDVHCAEAVARWVGMVPQYAELTESIARKSALQARRLAADELIAVLAHDLRIPLSAACGYAELLRRRLDRGQQSEEVHFVGQVERALGRLGEMISDLLDASRLEQGFFTVAAQPVDLVRLVGDATGVLNLPETPICVEAPEDVVAERADPARLRQAIENLVTNALHHSPVGVPVVVRLGRETRATGVWAILTVHDEGPGIAPTLLPTLFERFARGEGSRGMGLGLYLARGIAEAHNGTLTVDAPKGAGTTFRLSIPLAGVQTRTTP